MERQLRTIKGASRNMRVGAVYPIPSVTTLPGDDRFHRVTRVDQNRDMVFGVTVPKPEGPWWRVNKAE